MEGPIRVKAIAIIRREGEVLLSFAIDPDSGARYGRFLGGGVEPGETAGQTIRRELQEEIGVELCDVHRLGVVENVFETAQRHIHEVIFVFDAGFADDALYRRDEFAVNESVCDGPATWVPLERLLRGEIQVYPPALLDLIGHGRDVPTVPPAGPSNPM